MYFNWRMFDLRLACRKINSKTLDIFAHHAFRRTFVGNSCRSFQRLVDISKRAVFANKVQTVGFSHYAGMENEEYQDVKSQLRDDVGEMSRRERKALGARIRQADKESNDISFFASSARDGMLLADALARLPNVREVVLVPPSGRSSLARTYGCALPSSTRTFSILLACLELVGIRPHEIPLWIDRACFRRRHRFLGSRCASFGAEATRPSDSS